MRLLSLVHRIARIARIASIACACVPLARSAELTVRPLSGEEIAAKSLRLDGRRLTVESTAGARALDGSEILWIAVSAGPEEPTQVDDVLVRLVDGTQLVGRLGEATEDTIQLDVAALGAIAVPIDAVERAVFGLAAARPDIAGFDGEADADRVFRRGVQDTDFLRGTLVSIGRDGVRVDGDLGKVTLELGQVSALVVATGAHEPREPAKDAIVVEVELAGGSVLVGELVEISAATLRVRPGFGEPREVSFDAARRVRFKSTRFRYLSDLTPTKAEQAPFIGGSDDFLFEWQRDRSVSGGPLVVGGRRFGRGIGMHSHTKLTFDLAQGFEWIEGFAGVSDEVLALDCRGSVVFRVIVDGKPAWESPVLRSGEPARALPSIALAGASTLVIEVDFADEGDVCDRAVLGDPVLITKSP